MTSRARTLGATVLLLATASGCGSGGSGGPGGSEAEVPDAFSCPAGLEPWGEDDAPPLDDLAEQQEAAEVLEARSGGRSTFSVAHAEPSALGVVALVRGDVPRARRLLPDLVDVPVLVGRWREPQPEAGFGLAAQARQVVESRLLPVVDEVDAAVGGRDGDVGRVLWSAAGAVVVQWQEPVPSEVADLAGVRRDRVEVVVQGTRYSRAELSEAGDAVGEWLAEEDAPPANGTSGCADGSGLVVAMVAPVDDPAALSAELTEVAGMPVMVAEESALEQEQATPEADG